MKKYIPVIVGIGLPLLFILLLTLSVYIPSSRIKPASNFIYGVSEYYYHDLTDARYEYSVNKDGRLVREFIPARAYVDGTEVVLKSDSKKTIDMDFYLYDVKNNTSEKISFEDAQKLALHQGRVSPDGYTVEYRYTHSGIFELFGSQGAADNVFINKESVSKPLKGISRTKRYFSESDFKFIGWVK